jgi:catechol 2,3-dioxygenase-like lactoylglutathione lyase family enzyme
VIISNAPVCACLIVKDLKQAQKFYTEKLGLKLVPSEDQGGILLEAGLGSKIFIYQSDYHKPENTVAAFNVKDVLAAVNELKENGIIFESYDFDPIKTDENNIAHIGALQAAWFKDPEGNIIGLTNGV